MRFYENCAFYFRSTRSGSTLLTSILNQNPNFHSNISNPLARFVRSIVIESHNGPGYNLQCPENKRKLLIQNLIQTYHSDLEQPVCFNTNRGWTGLLPVLEQTNPKSKVICCVRDINWVLDSFELLFRKNPFNQSNLYSEYERETVYSRTRALFSPGHTVRFAYDSMKEAITGNQKHMLMLIEYNDLAKNPESTIRALYNFIGQPYFNHDFNNVEKTYDEYDMAAGIKGLHSIRNKVEYIERQPILPPDLFEEFSGLEVWR
jgi:sulfotransferase